MGLVRTTDAATEPVSTAEVKEFLRIDSGDDSQDVVLGIQIKSARETIEEYLRRSLITQTWTYTVSSTHAIEPLYLHRPPVIAITSLKTFDEDANGDETETTVDAANYQLVEDLFIVSRNDGWEINRRDRAAEIVYTAGYGSSASDVPSPIREACLRLVSTRYEFREDVVMGPRGGQMKVDTTSNILDDIRDFRYGGS